MKNLLTFAAFLTPVMHESQVVSLLNPFHLEQGLGIMKGLVTRGFTPKAAAAIAGNMYQESKFNPQVRPQSAPFVGLVQWGGARKSKLVQKPKWNALDTQLDFVKHEFDTIPSFKNILPSIEKLDVKQAASKIAKSYEGSADPNHPTRLNVASQLLDAYEADSNTAQIDNVQPK